MSSDLKFVSDFFEDEEQPLLQVCAVDEPKAVQVFQWQSYGEPRKDSQRGLILNDCEFIDKAREFLHSAAHDERADLVITPEYSFPLNVIQDEVIDKTIWPRKGNLWALSGQGEELEQFEDIVNKWDSESGINVLWQITL
ncbi:MAG: hypothetical protein ABEH43_03645 [Flavobacteriales bacterium]